MTPMHSCLSEKFRMGAHLFTNDFNTFCTEWSINLSHLNQILLFWVWRMNQEFPVTPSVLHNHVANFGCQLYHQYTRKLSSLIFTHGFDQHIPKLIKNLRDQRKIRFVLKPTRSDFAFEAALAQNSNSELKSYIINIICHMSYANIFPHIWFDPKRNQVWNQKVKSSISYAIC